MWICQNAVVVRLVKSASGIMILKHVRFGIWMIILKVTHQKFPSMYQNQSIFKGVICGKEVV
ncbi:MAG: hypothetical protein [Myoviridae sp. ctThM1]|nr:MAG: hypothetical protein [Myoviridae sp. ctThM1]